MSELSYIRKGSGPVLVLVHGFLGGATQWQSEIDTFSENFDVIAPDLPGFGDASQLPGCNTIEAMAEAVLGLLDHLEISSFDLMGHSMGGMIVQQMAAMRPGAIKKLILYGTGPLGLMPNRFEPIEDSSRRLQTDGVTKTIERIGATWFKADNQAKGFPLLVEIGSKASPQAAMGALEAMAAWDGRDALPKFAMPTLIIWGDSDKSYRWPQIETLWSNIPKVQLAVVPDTAHALHLEKPALFQALIADFIGG